MGRAMSENENIHPPTVNKFESILHTSEFKNIVKACNANPLFSHRYTDPLITLLAAHSLKDPELLLLAEIATEMGVAESSLIHPNIEGVNCVVSDVAEEEYAIYGDARAIQGVAPKAITDRNGSTHRRPKVSIYKISGAGLHIGFYRDLPLVIRKVGQRMETPCRILPNNHQMLNLIGGLPSESLDSAVKTVKNAVFIGDSFAFTNYAHWTLDWFPRLKWIIEEHCDAADLSIVFNRPPSSFHLQMLETVGFKPKNIIYPTAFTPTYFVKAEHIFATNIGREFRHSCHAGSLWSIDFLREKLYDENSSPFSPGIRLVIVRPQRGISFSSGALSTLKDKGFIFVRPELMDHRTQVALFANASAIIAPHGAGLSNLVFCKPGTHVLELFNKTLATHAFYTVALFGGLDYSCTVREAEEEPSSGKPIDKDSYLDEEILHEWLLSVGA